MKKLLSHSSGILHIIFFILMLLVNAWPVIYLEFPWWGILLVVIAFYFLSDILVGILSSALYVWALVVAFRSPAGISEIILFVFAAVYFGMWIINIISAYHKNK